MVTQDLYTPTRYGPGYILKQHVDPVADSTPANTCRLKLAVLYLRSCFLPDL